MDLVENWSLESVGKWLTSIGLESYIDLFNKQGITGRVLLMSDHEMLKELGIKSYGKRVSFLNYVKDLKIKNGIKMRSEEQDDVLEKYESLYLEEFRLNDKSLDQRITTIEYLELESALEKRDTVIKELKDEIENLKLEINDIKNGAIPVSPSSATIEKKMSWKKSKNRLGIPLAFSSPSASSSDNEKPFKPPVLPDSSKLATIKVFADPLLNRQNEPYKSLHVSMIDRAETVLKTVLKKYQITEDASMYALVCMSKFGKETILQADEKPLEIMHTFQASGEVIRFVLRRLPLPARIPVSQRATLFEGAQLIKSASESDFHRVKSLAEKNASASSALANQQQPGEETVIAIYEYKAENDDEFDITIGDKFIVTEKDDGWYVVKNIVGRVGYIPEGCVMPDSSNIEPYTAWATSAYDAVGPNEVSVSDGEKVKVIKEYQHWAVVLASKANIEGFVPLAYLSQTSPSDRAKEAEEKDGEVLLSGIVKKIESMFATKKSSSIFPLAKKALMESMVLYMEELVQDIGKSASVLSEEERNLISKMTSAEREKAIKDILATKGQETEQTLADEDTSKDDRARQNREKNLKRLTLTDFKMMIDTKAALKPTLPTVSDDVAGSDVLTASGTSEQNSFFPSTPYDYNIEDYKIIPYKELLKMKEEKVAPLEYDHLERYLSNNECLMYLKCTREDLLTLPSFKILQRKKRVGLL